MSVRVTDSACAFLNNRTPRSANDPSKTNAASASSYGNNVVLASHHHHQHTQFDVSVDKLSTGGPLEPTTMKWSGNAAKL